MIDFLYSLDISIFYFINVDLSNIFFDKFFVLITTSKNWTILYIYFIGWFIWKGQKKGRIALLVLIIAIVFADQLSSAVIKELVGRLRPCWELQNINLLVPCGEGKSFPSSHAVNSFTTAVVLSFFYNNYKYMLYIVASLIAFSRVYVGVHYPSDVLGGAILGVIIGMLIIMLFKLLNKKFKFIELT